MRRSIDFQTTWFDNIALQPETITASDGNLNPIELTRSIPKPAGAPVAAADYCDRIINAYRKGDTTWCLVQSGSGENVRFALVPQSAIGSPAPDYKSP